MRDSGINRFVVGIILSAYLVTGALGTGSLLGQTLFFRLTNSLSVQKERSVDLDERPYWTSHKHLISSEQFSSDHILSTAEPWISVIIPEQSVEIEAAHLPIPALLFPSNTLRAPPST